MNPSEEKTPGASGLTPGPADLEDRATGLPFLRSWRAVYAFVLAVFVLWIVLLTLLSGIFS